jgi:Ca2+-dependent lipid-binding protein
MSSAGKLKICILEAKLTHDTEPLGKMDPYVIVETRMQRWRTKTQEDAGKTPTWADEVLDVDVKYIGDDIHFAVMDEEVCADDHVGECTVKLSSFIGTKGDMDDWWEIQYEGKPAGHIHLKSKWFPTD